MHGNDNLVHSVHTQYIYPELRLAAGGVLECVDSVMEDKVGAAWAVVRPPGHHAEVRMTPFVSFFFQLF